MRSGDLFPPQEHPMAFEKVDPKVDFPGLEREILAFWDKADVAGMHATPS